MSERPLVTAVVPLYQGEAYVSQAIESVLAQDYEPIEVVVVDDGSTDRGPDLARALGARVLSQPNRGVATARNAGLAAARGELVAFLDQDDLWLPHKTSVQAGVLLAEPDLDYVGCLMTWFVEPGTAMPPWTRPEWFVEPQPAYIGSGILARASAFLRAGGFDVTYEQGSDTEWLARARGLGLRESVVEQSLVRHRTHEANHSHDVDGASREVFRILRASAARRRAS